MALELSSDIRFRVKTFCMELVGSIYIFSNGEYQWSDRVTVTEEDPYSFTSSVTIPDQQLVGVTITHAQLVDLDGNVMLVETISTPKVKGDVNLEISLKWEF